MKKRALVLGADAGTAGVYQCNRGEGAWSCMVAKYFSKLGYEIIIPVSKEMQLSAEYTNKQPKNCIFYKKPIENLIKDNVRFNVAFHHSPLHKNNKEQFDILSQIVDKFILGTHWPSAAAGAPPNVRLVAPFVAKDPVKHVVPRYAVEKEPTPQFSNKHIIWTARIPFSTFDQPRKILRTNLYHLEATYEAVQKDYGATILCYKNNYITTDRYIKNPKTGLQELIKGEEYEEYKRAKFLIDNLKNNTNVQFLNLMPQDKFIEKLTQGSISIPCNMAGSIVPSLLHGVVPVLFNSYNNDLISKELLNQLGAAKTYYYDYTKEEVHQRIFSLLEDESFYKNQFDILRTSFPQFTMDKACKLLEKAINA